LIKHTKVWKILVKNDFQIPEENLIFRQINSNYQEQYSNYNFVDPSTITRISPYANTNLYNLFFSNSPSWKLYPKRNKSLICGDKKNVDNRDHYFENSYVVLPFKNKIGVCSDVDIWQSFQDSISCSLERFFNYFKSTVQHEIDLNGPFIQLDDKNWDNLLKQLKNFDEKRKVNRKLFTEYVLIPTTKWEKKQQSTLELINEIFNPNANNFIIYKYDGSEKLPNNKEIWTDSHSLLIKYNEWYDFLKNVKTI